MNTHTHIHSQDCWLSVPCPSKEDYSGREKAVNYWQKKELDLDLRPAGAEQERKRERKVIQNQQAVTGTAYILFSLRFPQALQVMSSITALIESFLMDQQLSVIQVNTYIHGSLGRVQSNIHQVSGDKSCSDAIAFFLIIVVFRVLPLLGSCALMWKAEQLSHNALSAFILTSKVENYRI